MVLVPIGYGNSLPCDSPSPSKSKYHGSWRDWRVGLRLRALRRELGDERGFKLRIHYQSMGWVSSHFSWFAPLAPSQNFASIPGGNGGRCADRLVAVHEIIDAKHERGCDLVQPAGYVRQA